MTRRKPALARRAVTAIAAAATIVMALLASPAAAQPAAVGDARAWGIPSVGTVQPAPAGAFCVEPWCGDVDNRSRTPNAVRIAACWHNGDTTEWFGEYLPCEPQLELGWGDDGDNYYADVDAFRARGGCLTAWSTHASAEYHEHREGLGSKWIRVQAGTNVTILDVRCP